MTVGYQDNSTNVLPCHPSFTLNQGITMKNELSKNDGDIQSSKTIEFQGEK
jgi:hypothetical protein